VGFKVVILESAEHDLKDLRSYLVKNFSQATWQESYGKIKAVLRNLQAFPYAGAIPDEFQHLGLSQYRQVFSGINPHDYPQLPKSAMILAFR
jgi:toxin ParE1/3/4